MPSCAPVPRNSRFVTTLFLLILVAAVGLLLRLLAEYLHAIAFALVLTSLFYPLFSWILARVSQRRRAAAAATSTLIILGVLLPLSLLAVALSHEIVTAYERLATGEQPFAGRLLALMQSDHPMALRLRHLAAQVGIDVGPDQIRTHLANIGAHLAGYVYTWLRGAASNVLRTVLNLGIMLVVMFSLFVDGPRLKAFVLDLSPLPDTQEEMLARRFATISRAVFLGNGAASFLQGVLGGLSFYFFGIGSGLLWGAAIMLLAFLPVVGATVVFVPVGLFMIFAEGHVGLGLGFLAYNLTHVSLLEYGLKPRLIGGQSKMSGALVFVGVLAGLSLFGILGLFYGPLVLTMFLTVADIYKAEYRDDLVSLRSPWASADTAPAVAPDTQQPT